MGDLLRIVEFDYGGRPYGLLDLEQIDLGVAGHISKERDSFKVTPGQAARVDSAGVARFDGSRTVAEKVGNGSIAARWAVRGDDHDDALDNAATLLEHVRAAASRGRYIEWRPDGASRSTFYELRGTGDFTPDYRRMVFTQLKRLAVEISWPVAPLAELDRLDIIDGFDIPADAELLQTNLHKNPGAEVNVTDGGITLVNCTVARSTAQAHSGAASYQLTSLAAGNMTIRHFNDRAPCSPGESVVAAAYFRANTTTRTVQVYVDFYDGTGSRISATAGAGVAAPAGAWTRATSIQVAPAGTASVQIICEVVGPAAAGEVYFIDSQMLIKATSVPAYFDGDSDKARWTGTPHASTSELYDRSTLSDYTWTGAPGALIVANGVLKNRQQPAGQLWHTARGYEHADLMATVKATVTAIGANANYVASPGIKRKPNDNRYIWATNEGTNLRIYYFNGTTNASVATVALGFAIAVGTTLWVRVWAEGNVLFSDVWTAPPTPGGTPAAATTPFVLTEATTPKASEMGAARTGQASPRAWSGGDATTAGDICEFTVQPYTYRNRTLPEAIALAGAIPGDQEAPAKLDLHVTPSGGTAPPLWAMFGWWPRPAPWSPVWNGDFESDANGWSAAAVAGVLTAGTSVTREAAAAKYGAARGRIQVPGVGGAEGAAFIVYGRFRRGVTYTARIWVLNNTATPSVQLLLGVNGDQALSTAAATSAAWQEQTITWTPTADRDFAYIASRTSAALASTWAIDGATVYEGATAPSLATQTEGRGGRPPIGEIPAETASNVTVTADANYRGGNGVKATASGAGTLSLQFRVDPALLDPDAFTDDEIDVELWGRLDLPSTAVSPKAIASTFALGGTGLPARYTAEHGKSGKLLVKPSTGNAIRLHRLGTLTMYIDRRRPETWVLQLDITWAGGSSGSVGADVLYAVPIDRRAVSGPTARPYVAGEYPVVANTTAELERIFRHDGSGLGAHAGRRPTPAPGMSRGLELEPGDNETLVVLSSLVPDDPTSMATSELEDYAASLHYEVVPRVHLARGS